MDSIAQLQASRIAILDEIRSLGPMRRSTINEQFFPVQRLGQKQKSLRRPHYVLSRREGHKIVSRRLTSREDLDRPRAEVAAWRLVNPSPHLSRRTSLIFRIGNLFAGIFASCLGYQKAKDTRFSRDYPASLRNFPSHSGHLSDRRPKSGRFTVGIPGRNPSENV
jgi:hypothetical protein